MKIDYTAHARVFKAFCDENRLAILNILKTGERCSCKILEKLAVSQSTLSHHIRILCESGLVTGRQKGKWTYYSLSAAGCDYARTLVGAYANTDAALEPAEDCQGG